MSLGALQYPVKALLRSGVFEGKTTAKELAKLETPLSDKELCVAAAFLEEEIATPPSIAEANAESEEGAAARRQRQTAAAAEEASATKKRELSAEEQKQQNEALFGAARSGEMGKLEAAIAAGAEVDWHNPNHVSELSELE